MEGPEYPGEGAINIFYSRAYLVSALGTQKKIKMMAKCSSNTTKKINMVINLVANYGGRVEIGLPC